jgi:tRNA A37 methylthiotransferase MiaB
VKSIRARGIILQGCFVFGFDHDDAQVFRDTVEAVNQLKIDIPRYAVYTPYPGTKAYQRLKAAKRLLHERWEYYDTQHVVFQPAQYEPCRQLDDWFQMGLSRKPSASGRSGSG